MTVLRVLYKSGFKFDEVYYKGTHLPMVGSIMGKHGVDHVEMVKVASLADGSRSPYQVIFTAYFHTAAGVQAALTDPQIGDVMGDIAKFHDGAPDVVIGEVVDLP